MKTRIVIHRAYNKDGYIASAVEVAGQLYPFFSKFTRASDERWLNLSATEWTSHRFATLKSLKEWKQIVREYSKAYRFERIIALGESK